MRYNLSEINAIIRDRRSIKPEDFSDRKVHKEMIQVLLENARWAPTHGMTQPWYFKVFYGAGIQRLSTFQSDLYQQVTPPENQVEKKRNKLKERPFCASAIIALCMKRQETEKIPEIEEVAAVSCAVQNMFLTATAYGLAAYWGSGFPTYREETKAFLGLGPKDQCLGFFYIGYPSVEWPSGQRRPQEYFSDWVED